MQDPGSIVLIMFPITFGIIILVFIFILRQKKRPHPLESGRSPLYEDNSCGGLIGAVRSTMPFVRVSVYEDFLVVGSARGSILLRYDEISGVAVERVYFTKGVVIRHRRADAPERIVIWSSNRDDLLKHIESAMGKPSRP